MDDAFAVSRMPEIGLSGSMWRGPETERWQTYSGTKPETADTDKASLQRHRAGPRPDQPSGRSDAQHDEGGVVSSLGRTVLLVRRL